MKKGISSTTCAGFAAAVCLVLIYGVVQKLDNDAERIESERKVEVIRSAKAEFMRQQKWKGLMQEGERLTFPVASYRQLPN